MNERDLELALRKQRLVLKSAALRVKLRRDAQGLRPALSWADRAVEVAQWARAHSTLLVAVATTLAVARPRAAFRWAQRGFILWRSWQSVKARLLERLVR